MGGAKCICGVENLESFFLVGSIQYSHISGEQCDRGLFEVQCLPNDNEMIVTINKACHQQRFRGLSFDYSFMWGDESITTMSDPSNNSSAGVSATYSDIHCDTVRPNLGGVDSDGELNRPQWKIGLNQCNMGSTIQHENITEYHMYWNPNPLPGDVIFGLMDQVRPHANKCSEK